MIINIAITINITITIYITIALIITITSGAHRSYTFQCTQTQTKEIISVIRGDCTCLGSGVQVVKVAKSLNYATTHRRATKNGFHTRVL
jgi:exo-beta-1,3-glucanase (GH17 family)